MGKFVYGEGEYLHDMSHGFSDAYAANGGDDWKSSASFLRCCMQLTPSA